MADDEPHGADAVVDSTLDVSATSTDSRGDGPLACNGLLGGTPVEPTYTTALPPAAEGGRILNGDYLLTGVTYYSASDAGASGVNSHIVGEWLVANGGMQFYVLDDAAPESIERRSATFALDGDHDIIITWTCGVVGASPELAYSATVDEIVLYVDAGGSDVAAFEFTRR